MDVEPQCLRADVFCEGLQFTIDAHYLQPSLEPMVSRDSSLFALRRWGHRLKKMELARKIASSCGGFSCHVTWLVVSVAKEWLTMVGQWLMIVPHDGQKRNRKFIMAKYWLMMLHYKCILGVLLSSTGCANV